MKILIDSCGTDHHPVVVPQYWQEPSQLKHGFPHGKSSTNDGQPQLLTTTSEELAAIAGNSGTMVAKACLSSMFAVVASVLREGFMLDGSMDSGSLAQPSVETDLLQVLFEGEQAYPWNPANPETAAYFADQESAFSLEDWSTDELAPGVDALFNCLNQQWARVESATSQAATTITADTLQTTLGQRFSMVPSDYLGAIARRARDLYATNLSLLDQLVECVREVLPALGEDDLQVLARPLAYAMRSGEGEAINGVLNSLRSPNWDELSEVEQARLGLAIARAALAELGE